jgi:hypothetical protein
LNHQKRSKIIFFVILAHGFLLLYLFWSKKSYLNTHISKKIIVNTYSIEPPPIKKRVIKRIIYKSTKTSKAKTLNKKKPQLPSNLLTDLEKSLKSLEDSSEKSSDKTKKALKNFNPSLSKIKLNIDLKDLNTLQNNNYSYKDLLVRFLQENLNLPEMGSIKAEITLKPDNTLKEIHILSSASETNEEYIRENLEKLIFPRNFKTFTTEKKEISFIINFKNKEF